MKLEMLDFIMHFFIISRGDMKYFTVILFLLLALPCYAQVSNFDDISGLKLWVEADSIEGLSDGDNLSVGALENAWRNLVFAGGDSGFSTLDPRYPSWETNEINTTKSVVFFDSSSNSEELIVSGTTDLDYVRFTHQWDKTIFVVLKIPVDVNTPLIPLDSRSNSNSSIGMTLRILDNGTTLDGILNTHAGPVGSNNFNFNSANNAFTYGQWQILTVWVSTSDDTARSYVDTTEVGKQVITGTEPSANSSYSLSLGREGSGVNSTSIHGPIPLVLMYDRALTSTELCQVWDLIACRYPDVFSDSPSCEVTCPTEAAAAANVRRRGLLR
jgi:hypothetical protein